MLDIVIFGNGNEKDIDKTVLSIAFQMVSLPGTVYIVDNCKYPNIASFYDDLSIQFIVQKRTSMRSILKPLFNKYVYFIDAGDVIASPLFLKEFFEYVDKFKRKKNCHAYCGSYVIGAPTFVQERYQSFDYYFPMIYKREYLLDKVIFPEKNAFFFYVNYCLLFENQYVEIDLKMAVAFTKYHDFSKLLFSYLVSLDAIMKKYGKVSDALVHRILFFIYVYYLENRCVYEYPLLKKIVKRTQFNVQLLSSCMHDIDTMKLLKADITFLHFIELIKEGVIC